MATSAFLALVVAPNMAIVVAPIIVSGTRGFQFRVRVHSGSKKSVIFGFGFPRV